MARTRAQDYEAKRELILRKSAELFAQFGYSGTSVSLIADACGVSKALLYHYYPDKEAVLFDILLAHLEVLVEVAEAVAAGPLDGEERLYALSAALLETYRDADAEHQVQISNLKLLPADKQDVLRTLERRLVEIFSAAIARAIPVAAGGPRLKALTMSLFGMLNWHYLWFKDGKGLSRQDYARLATRLILSGAGPALEELSRDDGSAVALRTRADCR